MQGPPGTGKTHTIVAIAAAVLLEKASSSFAAGHAARSHPATGRLGRGRQGEEQQPPHCRLLICAQSNAAVDELISRLAQQVRCMLRRAQLAASKQPLGSRDMQLTCSIRDESI